MCPIWIFTRLLGPFFLSQNEPQNSTKKSNGHQYLSLHADITLLTLNCSFLLNGQLYSVTYILSMNLSYPFILFFFFLLHHAGNKIISHQRRTLLREEITQALNQMQVEQEGLVLLYCLII